MNTNTLVITNHAAAAATNDIRAIRPPLDLPNPWFWVWLALAVLTLAALIIAVWYYFSSKTSQPVAPPVISPHVRTRQKLQDALALINQPRPFCIAVSDTVRLYLEERFDFRAPERTTEEFLHELQATDLLLPDQKQTLGEFLSVCDMVKFARYEPGRPELQALHDSAVRLVDETEPRPVAPESAAASQTLA
jgi:hypothetical protein